MFAKVDDKILIDENQLMCKVISLDNNKEITTQVVKTGEIFQGGRLILKSSKMSGPILKKEDK